MITLSFLVVIATALLGLTSVFIYTALTKHDKEECYIFAVISAIVMAFVISGIHDIETKSNAKPVAEAKK